MTEIVNTVYNKQAMNECSSLISLITPRKIHTYIKEAPEGRFRRPAPAPSITRVYITLGVISYYCNKANAKRTLINANKCRLFLLQPCSCELTNSWADAGLSTRRVRVSTWAFHYEWTITCVKRRSRPIGTSEKTLLNTSLTSSWGTTGRPFSSSRCPSTTVKTFNWDRTLFQMNPSA